mmetsp:Transcript_34684/g.56277  ORF Transcript_34684/g.56277 Transcript_34684/m.56277 type:complete len:97 (+) Transcript_34684:268-558(+)
MASLSRKVEGRETTIILLLYSCVVLEKKLSSLVMALLAGKREWSVSAFPQRTVHYIFESICVSGEEFQGIQVAKVAGKMKSRPPGSTLFQGVSSTL